MWAIFLQVPCQGDSLTVKLQAELRRATEVQIAWDDLAGTFNISQWIAALKQAGYGQTLLFEVPIPRPERPPALDDGVSRSNGAAAAVRMG